MNLGNGARCEGNFFDGELNGDGSFYFLNGNKYNGKFKNGKGMALAFLFLTDGGKIFWRVV